MMQSAAALTTDSSDPPVSAPRDPLRVAWGHYLRSLRKGLDLTQEQLAIATGVTANTISGLESGHHDVSLETLKRLRQVFPELLSPTQLAQRSASLGGDPAGDEPAASHALPQAVAAPTAEPDPDAQRLQQDIARLAAENARLAAERAQLEELANRDGLTGLPNVRAFEVRRLEEVARARRAQSHLSYIRIDLDHFKQINDVYGHPVGDQVLIQVGGLLSGLRKVDCAARLGGEEFAILCFNTDVSEAAILAERLRQQIEQQLTAFIRTQQPVEGRQLPEPTMVTASFGISSLEVTVGKEIADEALAKQLDVEADEAAIQAKSNGRNRIEVASRLAGEVDLLKASATAAESSAQMTPCSTGRRARREWSRWSKLKVALAIAAACAVLAGLGALGMRTLHLGMAGCSGGPTPDKPPASSSSGATASGCPDGQEKAVIHGEERCIPKAEKVPDCKDTNGLRPCCNYGKERCP